jgi:hypothetical protein
MWAVAIVAEHAAIYSASEVDMIATGVGMEEFASMRVRLWKNHVSDGGAASVRAILPTGVGEDG